MNPYNFNNQISTIGFKLNPSKVDPTKQDERDNDPTRLKPSGPSPERPEPTQPVPGVPQQPSEPGIQPSKKHNLKIY